MFRISFSGEPAYEVNVPWGYGAALWEALWAAGQPSRITAYGTESMHVLRAEKGYIIVGQDTDGTVTPHDLGMDWIVGKAKKDFIGKRGMARSDLQAPDRKQLVGLLTEDPAEVLEEGAQVVATAEVERPPVPMIGHVTSSYASPNVGRSVAMALVRGGPRPAETVYVPMPGKVIPATVTKPVFFDPGGPGSMAEPARTSPLAALARAERGVAGPAPVTLAALPFRGKLIVRGDEKARARASTALGWELPGALRSASGGSVEALWLGPDEWLFWWARTKPTEPRRRCARRCPAWTTPWSTSATGSSGSRSRASMPATC